MELGGQQVRLCRPWRLFICMVLVCWCKNRLQHVCESMCVRACACFTLQVYLMDCTGSFGFGAPGVCFCDVALLSFDYASFIHLIFLFVST